MSIRPTLLWSTCPVVEDTNFTAVPECADSSETQFFWYREALDITGSIDDLGAVRWWMFVALVASWAVVYFIIMKGIQVQCRFMWSLPEIGILNFYFHHSRQGKWCTSPLFSLTS